MLERYRVYIVGALTLVLVVAGAVIYVRRPTTQPVEILEPSPPPRPSPVPVAVYVTGAVLNPGVHYLTGDTRVEDALEAAGGPTAQADLESVNLARVLQNEDHVHFPEVGEGKPPPPGVSSSNGGLININTASGSELEELPGIGPALAQCIIDHRDTHGPFATVEEIMDVRGIGQGTFEDIRDLITVK